jgi:ribosome biogenesis GTPase A
MKPRYSFSSRHNRKTEKIRKQKPNFPKQLEQVIDIADIVLEVLDARFISETRNREVENAIKDKSKKLIRVLNKSDLVKKIPQYKLTKLIPYAIVSAKTKNSIGRLRDKIKEFSSKVNTDDKVTVGVIGYPNSGKSSVINALLGKSKASTSHQSGHTKGLQKLKLSEHIMLLDSPGVIPQEEYSTTDSSKMAQHAKLGAKSYEKVKDPEIVLGDLIKVLGDVFEKHYKIKAGKNSEILIEELGKKKNFVKQKGLVDEDRTARFILKEWQTGKIKI